MYNNVMYNVYMRMMMKYIWASSGGADKTNERRKMQKKIVQNDSKHRYFSLRFFFTRQLRCFFFLYFRSALNILFANLICFLSSSTISVHFGFDQKHWIRFFGFGWLCSSLCHPTQCNTIFRNCNMNLIIYFVGEHTAQQLSHDDIVEDVCQKSNIRQILRIIRFLLLVFIWKKNIIISTNHCSRKYGSFGICSRIIANNRRFVKFAR